MTYAFNRLMTISSALALALSTAVSAAASFDCATARSQAEKLICADRTLSELDERLAQQFQISIKSAASEDVAARTRSEQRAWLRHRDGCRERACLESLYRERLDELGRGSLEQPVNDFGIAGKTHAQVAAARQPAPKDAPAVPIFAHFTLTRGQGQAVCVAYLERLNRSWFPNYPSCDRPQDDRVKGFRNVEHSPLTPEQVQPFWASMRSFVWDGDPDLWKRHEAWLKERGLPPRFGDRERQLEIVRGETSLQVFGFQQPIDLDNDGRADPVVIWREGQCGYFDGALPRSWTQIPVVLNAQGDGPDVERTRKLVGHPVDGYRLPSGQLTRRFRPIGLRMSVFWFEGLYYMDAFFDEWGDFANQRRDDPEIGYRLGVFLNQAGTTTQVCEYLLQDFIDSAGVTMRRQIAASKRDKRPR
jgi:uncharacterized protein